MGTFPEALQELLRERGWNQSEAAVQLEISQGLVSAYLRGEREPTLSTLLNIASRIGVPIGKLVGEEISQQRGKHHGRKKALPQKTGRDQPPDAAMLNLKRRWKKKPHERATIKHLVAALFPENAQQVLVWLDRA